MKCNVEKCEKEAQCKSYCKSHYDRWRLYGEPERKPVRFLITEKVFLERLGDNKQLISIWDGGNNPVNIKCILQ